MKNKFSQNLKELRKERNLRQDDLGAIFNVSKQVISLYETGRNEPCIDDLIMIADFFDVSIDELVGREY